MPDQEMDVTHRTRYEFTKRDFGDAVYVEVRQHNFTCTIIGTGNDPEVRRTANVEKKWGVCVNRATYAFHGGLADPSWVLYPDEEEEYVAVTQEYMDAYRKDQHYQFRRDNSITQDVLPMLEAGRFDLIVRANESVFFDLNRNPIPRWFRFDYISGNIRGGKYYMGKVTDHLKKHSRCHEVEREAIPSYNAEFRGETAVEFYYESIEPEFTELINNHDSFERLCQITKALGLERFERKNKERKKEDD